MNLTEQNMGDESWAQFAQMSGEQFLAEERGALHRVAQGTASIHDAAFLARSRGREEVAQEILRPKVPVYACVYCGREVNDGCPDPAMFVCCGEIGHTEPIEEIAE